LLIHVPEILHGAGFLLEEEKAARPIIRRENPLTPWHLGRTALNRRDGMKRASNVPNVRVFAHSASL
jgi:hypothetical protein